ncbi:TIGR03792 family protein [Kamptonema sp. UHCC 0994]|uniref:TIGR03792 family protein n=1 Tax=Kamptonema sp. UHCC 0994 TaxID=3031329 RepID=UPI0023BA39DB|nr:TIGR03792 family protein [Kamptonema sp. UHCC 0994]MDF0554348.1 TIGR03792 family protein [Kamptonema sp. UHCC 0994]
MIIEWLKFRVPAEKCEAFIQRDEEVWTAGLRSFPGFLGKETWVDSERNEVIFMIRWETREQLKSIPQNKLDEIDLQMGDLQMPIVESREYQVRKFLH